MKEVRFGLIGLGAMGMAHAKTLLGDVPNARLCAAATASQTHAAELLAQPDVDGGLIGGASLKPADFATIVKAASK